MGVSQATCVSGQTDNTEMTQSARSEEKVESMTTHVQASVLQVFVVQADYSSLPAGAQLLPTPRHVQRCAHAHRALLRSELQREQRCAETKREAALCVTGRLLRMSN